MSRSTTLTHDLPAGSRAHTPRPTPPVIHGAEDRAPDPVDPSAAAEILGGDGGDASGLDGPPCPRCVAVTPWEWLDLVQPCCRECGVVLAA